MPLTLRGFGFAVDSPIVSLLKMMLKVDNMEILRTHPIVGASWESFVIENLLNCMSNRVRASYYRSNGGLEIDLTLEMPNGELWAIEIKRSSIPKVDKGFYRAREDIKAHRSFLVYPGSKRYSKGDGIEVIGVREMAALVASC